MQNLTNDTQNTSIEQQSNSQDIAIRLKGNSQNVPIEIESSSDEENNIKEKAKNRLIDTDSEKDYVSKLNENFEKIQTTIDSTIKRQNSMIEEINKNNELIRKDRLQEEKEYQEALGLDD